MSAIFYHDQDQKKMAEQSIRAAQPGYKKPITTLIIPATEFFNAEDYHQKYILQKHDWLMAALKLCRGKQLIMSSVAARVNGYVGGYGDKENFLSEKDALGLSEEVSDYVVEQIDERQYG
eukprot:TRINITY_DN6508_c0_g1_i2.p1 TRINITY_DN6508_c0_g1~~TRINITY_DN6508_c0_g1_i2.p1  ORF type:complete len:120 (-),score=38.08 TRINITY_DN6508_c0_g1_i2:124-483(-)